MVRAGLPEPEQGAPFLPGPEFAAPFHLRGDPADADYGYGREGNPTWTRVRARARELEGGEAVLFASGMAAGTAVLLTCLRPGDALTMPSDCYMHVRDVAAESTWAARGGGHAAAHRRARPEALAGADRPALARDALQPGPRPVRHRGRSPPRRTSAAPLVAVDNTFATPLGQRPLELGADFSVTSATKHLGGHADLLLGYVAARDPARAEALRDLAQPTGSIAGPFETWLAHRSLATLDVRLERGEANALALAELLDGPGRGRSATPACPPIPPTSWHAADEPLRHRALLRPRQPRSARRHSWSGASWSPTPPASAAC